MERQSGNARISQRLLDGVYIEIASFKNPRYEIINLSRGGFAFIIDLDEVDVDKKEKLEGVLYLSNYDNYKVFFSIVHIQDKHVGCKIIEVEDSFEKIYHNFFCTKLKELDVKKQEGSPLVIDETAKFLTHMFTGSHSCELFYAISGDEILYGHIILFGLQLEFSDKDNITLRTVSGEKSTSDNSKIYVKTMVDYILFLENVTGLDPDHKYKLVDIIGNDL